MVTATGRIVTPGTLLGGRVRHDQFADGHRTGLEPVFLAASVPARPGARVLEAGTGSGAALLCLAARVPGLRGVGVEREADAADLARSNFAANRLADLVVETSEIETASATHTAAFDHAMANPPWHRQAATPSPDAGRDAAHRADPGLLTRWITRLGAALVRRGTLTLIVASDGVPDCLAGFAAARLGTVALFPLWPRAGMAAKLVLLQAVREGRGPCRIFPGLAIHEADGLFTPAAQAVLREGHELRLR